MSEKISLIVLKNMQRQGIIFSLNLEFVLLEFSYCDLQDSFRCGYATIHNVLDKSIEDRMESFFLSETTKYLYLVIFWTF